MKEEASEPRSYNVKTADGSELRRNRAQLKPLEKTTSQANSNKESPSKHRDLSLQLILSCHCQNYPEQPASHQCLLTKAVLTYP